MSNFEFMTRDLTISPTIYAFRDKNHPEWGYKVGYTDRKAEVRVKEAQGVIKPSENSIILEYETSAIREDGSVFTDHDVHRMLMSIHCPCLGGEWYNCSIEQLDRAVCAVRNRLSSAIARTQDFKLRPEQKEAIKRTIEYYNSAKKEYKAPKFLWNCKMRFGKTFASYELAKNMNLNRILILTFKPAVKSAWKEDLLTHKDFLGWQFLAQPSSKEIDSDNLDVQYQKANKSRPIVCFGSFQDLLGLDRKTGQIKAHNGWIHTTNWDLVIFDEYHFGAWRERSKDLFEKEDDEELINKENNKKDNDNYDIDSSIDETFLPITTSYYLYLSGTPFRAINSGEFIEEQIYSWTYSDEQEAKLNWKGENGPNPYVALPRMVMMTYKLPESIRRIALDEDFNEFDLNTFFSTKGEKKEAHFIYEEYVQKWIDLIRGNWMESALDELKSGRTSPFPFSDIRLRQTLQHTLWFLPSVNSCYAMKYLLMQRQNTFFKDYRIVVCAGADVGQGAEALVPVENAMGDPLETKTITLSCGKLTTGVTVKPWSGVFMLRNLKQPETYFQTAFRVQSPWTVGKEIIKKECYVFDFAPNRTLRQLAEYSCHLNVREHDPEKKVNDFIKFLPVLSYEGNMMREIDAAEILDIAMSGTSATLLARRWESALLVNVDNETLERLLSNEKAMKALMSIVGFRSLNKDIETIITKSNAIKDAKRRGEDKSETTKKRKELSDEEKEYKSKRKQIQEKLVKFATRIPIFMFLTDYREVCLQDVVTKLEPQLFKKVTGLNVDDFELLASLGLFNEALMNDAIFKFRRYEESSLDYTGINKHYAQNIGGYSTVLKNDEYVDMYGGKPVIKVGEKVIVEGYGTCTITSVKAEKFTVKQDSNNARSMQYLYPIAFELGTVKKIM